MSKVRAIVVGSRSCTSVVIALVTSIATSQAQPAGAQAEALFREGRDLMDKGKLDEACAAFEQSQKLEPAITTLLNLAGCREDNHQIASAWGLFLEAERQTRSASDATSQQLHESARDHAKKLEPRVSKLTISVSAESRIDQLEILRGNEPLEKAMWNHSLPVDGGAYTITARAPGAAAWTTTVTVAAEADTKTVDIPKLQTVAPPPPRETGKDDEESATRPGRRSKLVPLVIGAGSIVVLGAALGFELSGESTYSQSKKEADPTKQDDLWHSANTKRYVAEGLAVTGLAGAGVAVWLYVRNSGDRSSTSSATARRIHVVPIASADRAGVGVMGRF